MRNLKDNLLPILLSFFSKAWHLKLVELRRIAKFHSECILAYYSFEFMGNWFLSYDLQRKQRLK